MHKFQDDTLIYQNESVDHTKQSSPVKKPLKILFNDEDEEESEDRFEDKKDISNSSEG